MPANHPTPPPLPGEADQVSPRGVPLRFSMRTLFRVMTGLALLCGFGAILPAAFSQIVLGGL